MALSSQLPREQWTQHPMDDSEFLNRIRQKIEEATQRPVELEVDAEEETRISVDLESAVPRVVLGSGIFRYPGLARLGVEYAVACLRAGRPLSQLEFHVRLQRN